VDELQNRRRYTRSKSGVAVSIDLGETEVARGQVRDVTVHSVFVETDFRLGVGSGCGVRISLEGITPPVEIRGFGKVVRVEPGGFCIDFTHLDRSSFEHLCQLVLHNAKDPDRVLTELEGGIDADSPSTLPN